MVCLFDYMKKIALDLYNFANATRWCSISGKFETLYWDVHLLANKTGLGQLWDDPADYFQEN
jgi:hypothetical protein